MPYVLVLKDNVIFQFANKHIPYWAWNSRLDLVAMSAHRWNCYCWSGAVNMHEQDSQVLHFHAHLFFRSIMHHFTLLVEIIGYWDIYLRNVGNCQIGVNRQNCGWHSERTWYCRGCRWRQYCSYDVIYIKERLNVLKYSIYQILNGKELNCNLIMTTSWIKTEELDIIGLWAQFMRIH